jgi:transcriptional regulator with XRE-family HTH domain
MPEKMTGSTVPRRQLGRNLRELRTEAGLTVRGAAQLLEWSEAKVWRIETGQSALRSHDVATMCRIYGAGPGVTEGLMGLAKETKARGWWHAYGDVIPEYFDVYIGLEGAASDIATYQAELVPGLLQTEDCARALIKIDNPGVDEEEIDKRVHVRMARQGAIRRATDPLQLHVILNESIIRRPLAGHSLWAAQLDHLAQTAELPNISLRVVPFTAGFHFGVLSGSFVILRFAANGGRDSEPPTVYADGFTGALYLDKPHEVGRYTEAFDSIRRVSCDEAASRNLIHQAAEELRQ